MTSQLFAVCFDAVEPERLARFWSGLLGFEVAHGGGFQVRFLPTEEPKAGPNRMHFDLTSTSLEDQQETAARALGLGARHIDVGQLPEEGHVVLADPEGNEFCVVEAGNKFLTDCGFVGALSCDGSQAVGYFWSAALGWPLVWDQDQETAIQAPHGGSKISWGGPPVAPKTGRNRVHLELAADGEPQREVDRLVSLGAARVAADRDEPGRVAMIDPDGNEFCVLTAG